jgi:phosphonate transport system substrate-binding protein
MRATSPRWSQRASGDERFPSALLDGRVKLRNRNRRLLLGLAAAAVALPVLPAGTSAGARPALRFATTPVFLDNQVALLGQWQRYLQERLQRPVQFLQRGSYREILDLLLSDAVDVAWLCGYPFVLEEARLRLLAVPHYAQAPLYRSHLIVPAQDSRTQGIRDLAGRVFAFSDPLSNSGHLVPRMELLRAGLPARTFFRRSFFTFGHRKVVDAVRYGLADAGAVDGYVWDTIVRQHPEEAAGIRVAWRSPPHGFPPIVARAALAAPERDAFATALLQMRHSALGIELLDRLNLDGFELASVALFDSIRVLVREQARHLA